MVWKAKSELKFLVVRGLPSMVEHFLQVAFPKRRLLASVINKEGAVTCLVQPDGAEGAQASTGVPSGALARCGAALNTAEKWSAAAAARGLDADLLEDGSWNASGALEVRWVPSSLGWELPTATP